MLSSLFLQVLKWPSKPVDDRLEVLAELYKGVSCLLHTWLVISLVLLQQCKVDTEILVPVSVGDTWAFYKPW